MKKTISVLFFLFSTIVFAQKQGQEFIDSSLARLTTLADDSNKIDLLTNLSFAYSSVNPDEGIKYGEQALELSEKLDAKRGIAESLNSLGINYASKSNFSKALEYHFKSLKIKEEIGDKPNIASSYSNIGIVYDNQKDYPKALEYYHKSLAIFQETGNKHGIATIFGNIGLVYNAQQNYPMALENILKALAIVEELGDKGGRAGCLGNIGSIYFYQNNFAKALEYDSKALALDRELGDKAGEAINLCNIGEIYYGIATDSSLELLKKLFSGNKTLALRESIRYLNDATAIFSELGFVAGMQETYKYLSMAYESLGEYKSALESHRQHIVFKDSIFNDENSQRISKLEKDRSDDLKQKEIEIQKLQLEKARNERWYFYAGILLLIILSGVLYNRFRLKKISSEKLQASYDQLEKTQTQLIHQEKMASLGMLTAGIAHEIQNPLNFVTNFSDSSMEIIKELNETTDENEKKQLTEELTMNIEKIHTHGKRADNIIKSMLRHSHGQQEEKRLTNIHKLCDEFITLAYHGIRASNPDFNCAIEKNYEADMPKVNLMSQEITRVLLNLFNNSFHALKERQQKEKDFSAVVTITTKLKDQFVEVHVRDNGTGIPQKIRDKIFQPFFTTKSTGEGTGLGLSISYDIIKAHGGELKVDSKEGEFTEFVITLPLV